MRRTILLLIMICILALPAKAIEVDAPQVPEDAAQYLPQESGSFGERLAELLRRALDAVAPGLGQAAAACFGVLAAAVVCGIFQTQVTQASLSAANLLGVAAISTILLQSTDTFLRLGLDTVRQISDYGGLLLPVMSAALIASGGGTKASAMYLGTAFCDSVLTRLISNGIAPMIYLFIATAIASAALGNDLLERMRDFFKGLITWSLKVVLYFFTGYMTITGVVSGAADATAVRAAKLTISGVVPVVGSILSDASEAVLVGADVVRGTAGVSGLLALLAITLVPFLKVGIQYLLLKLTAAWCGVLGDKRHTALTDAFSQAMGMILGMVGTCCLLQLISVVCFMKGVS